MERATVIIFYVSISVLQTSNIVHGAPPGSGASVRIMKEIREMKKEPTPGISAEPDEKDFRHFHVKLEGPKDSPFEGGVFELDLTLPEDYPSSPPSIKFRTKVYHPNVNSKGGICLDTLQENWTPILGIRTALLSVQALLAEPFLGHFLSVDIGNLWKKDPEKAKHNAREFTRMYAMKQSQGSSSKISKNVEKLKNNA